MERGYDMKQGARPMRRTIQDMVEDPLATGLLSGQFQSGDTITISRKGDELHLSAERSPAGETEVDEAESPAPVTPAE
jgi:ATP-dependent Clp protease ATP-binding subunit ClpC